MSSEECCQGWWYVLNHNILNCMNTEYWKVCQNVFCLWCIWPFCVADLFLVRCKWGDCGRAPGHYHCANDRRYVGSNWCDKHNWYASISYWENCIIILFFTDVEICCQPRLCSVAFHTDTKSGRMVTITSMIIIIHMSVWTWMQPCGKQIINCNGIVNGSTWTYVTPSLSIMFGL